MRPNRGREMGPPEDWGPLGPSAEAAGGKLPQNVHRGLTSVPNCVTVFWTTEQDKGSAQENGGKRKPACRRSNTLRRPALGRGLCVDVTLEKLDDFGCRRCNAVLGTGRQSLRQKDRDEEAKRPCARLSTRAGACFFAHRQDRGAIRGPFFVRGRKRRREIWT